MADSKIHNKEDIFHNFVSEFSQDKCCIIDSASVMSGIAKYTAKAMKSRNAIIEYPVFIWFIGMLFIQVLKYEFETHQNKIFVCVIRECSIIPEEVLKNLGLKSNTYYICKILHKMKNHIQKNLPDCIFKVIGADTKSQDCSKRSEVDDALCILLSSQLGDSHILTCDGYNSFRTENGVKFPELTIKKCRSGNKFKPIVSLSNIDVISRKCHNQRAKKFRVKLENMCGTANYEELYKHYLASATLKSC